jgi:hypothetical protein
MKSTLGNSTLFLSVCFLNIMFKIEFHSFNLYWYASVVHCSYLQRYTCNMSKNKISLLLVTILVWHYIQKKHEPNSMQTLKSVFILFCCVQKSWQEVSVTRHRAMSLKVPLHPSGSPNLSDLFLSLSAPNSAHSAHSYLDSGSGFCSPFSIRQT